MTTKRELKRALEELYELVEKEYTEELSFEESDRYMELVDLLREFDVEIPFEINY